MKQTFVKAAIMASFMAAVSCGQAPTEQGPAQYGVTTIATTDREIQSNYSATIRGRQDIDIYRQFREPSPNCVSPRASRFRKDRPFSS